MLAVLKIEWLKIKKYPAFWWMLGIVALSYPGINYMTYLIYSDTVSSQNTAAQIAKTLLLGNPFSFPQVWLTVAYFSSFFVLIPAILIIMLIANEYTFKTNRQNIIDGWTKDQFILSKLGDVLIISVVVTIVYTLISLIFGFSVSTEFSKAVWASQIKYLPLFFLQVFAQLSFAFLIGFLIKRSFIALGVFIFWGYIIEPILSAWIQHGPYTKSIAFVGKFLPLEISDKLIPPPSFFSRFSEEGGYYQKLLNDVTPHVFYTIGLTALIWWLCFYVYRKRDL